MHACKQTSNPDEFQIRIKYKHSISGRLDTESLRLYSITNYVQEKLKNGFVQTDFFEILPDQSLRN